MLVATVERIGWIALVVVAMATTILVMSQCSNTRITTITMPPLVVRMNVPREVTATWPKGADSLRVRTLLDTLERLRMTLKNMGVKQSVTYDTIVVRGDGRHDTVTVVCDDVQREASLEVRYAPLEVPRSARRHLSYYLRGDLAHDLRTVSMRTAVGIAYPVSEAVKLYGQLEGQLKEGLFQGQLCAGFIVEL